MAAKFKVKDDYAEFAQRQAQMNAEADDDKKRHEEEDKQDAALRKEQLQWFAKSVDSDKTAQERGRDDARKRRKDHQHKGKTAQVRWWICCKNCTSIKRAAAALSRHLLQVYMSGYPMGLINQTTIWQLFEKYGTV